MLSTGTDRKSITLFRKILKKSEKNHKILKIKKYNFHKILSLLTYLIRTRILLKQ